MVPSSELPLLQIHSSACSIRTRSGVNAVNLLMTDSKASNPGYFESCSRPPTMSVVRIL